MAFFRTLSVVVSLAAGSSCAALAPRAIVVGDVTAEGAKRRTPTHDAPVYYFPVIAGYRELGALVGGTKPPIENDVLQALVKALAQEHYRIAKPGTTPELMLVLWWGSINPLVDEMEQNVDEVAPTQIFYNQREMLSLVGAFKADAFFKFDSDQLKDAARDDRYFILIGAYDFAAAEKKERKLLWSARMSTESTGRAPDKIFPILAASGAAVFGRDTAPALLDTSKPIKSPEIEMGPTTIVDELAEDKKH